MSKLFGAIIGCTVITLAAPSLLQAQEVTIAPGTALRIELDRRVRIHVGASVVGHLTEPIYLIDHEVVPAGAPVSGTIHAVLPGSRSDHIRRLLAADFTPPKVAGIVFDSITLPANKDHATIVLQIDAPAVPTDASVLSLGAKKQKQSIKAQAIVMIKQRKQDVTDLVNHHQYAEIVEKWAIGQLPYHPEILWSKARFNADLATSMTLPDTPHPTLPLEDLGGRLPEGTLHARLVSPLTSHNAKHNDPVEAIITQPLLSADRSKVLVPEGTHLHGVVVKSKSARSFGRNGDLRFAFRNLDLPTSDGSVQVTEIHGRLSAAETAPGQHVTIDEEGQVQAGDGPGKYAEPILLGILATAAMPDPDHRGVGDGVGPGAQTVSSNGFGLIARIVALSTQNTQVLEGFAFYSLGKSIYFNFIAKGHDTTFAKDTEIQVTLSQR